MTSPRPPDRADPRERRKAAHPLATTPEPAQQKPSQTWTSPWLSHTAWISDPTAAPVELLAPLRELGFSQLCVRGNSGAQVADRIFEHLRRYEAAGWQVTTWGRCDQRHDKDERADPQAVQTTILFHVPMPYAANVEIRWSAADSEEFASMMNSRDAVCTYPGGMPDDAHQYYQQAGCRVVLVQTFGETEPWTIDYLEAEHWGLARGYPVSLPMVGVWKGTHGHPDAAAQAAALGSRPRHAYLVEQALSGQYNWAALMRGAS